MQHLISLIDTTRNVSTTGYISGSIYDLVKRWPTGFTGHHSMTFRLLVSSGCRCKNYTSIIPHAIYTTSSSELSHFCLPVLRSKKKNPKNAMPVTSYVSLSDGLPTFSGSFHSGGYLVPHIRPIILVRKCSPSQNSCHINSGWLQALNAANLQLKCQITTVPQTCLSITAVRNGRSEWVPNMIPLHTCTVGPCLKTTSESRLPS